MQQGPSLVVVRGARATTDPTFACMAHDTRPNHYLALTLDKGSVVDRQIFRAAERKAVEQLMADKAHFRGGVYADTRTQSELLPLRVPKHAQEADLATFRRAKSDEEMASVRRLNELVYGRLHMAESEAEFRGVEGGDDDATDVSKEDLQAAYKRTETVGFVEYRGGFRDSKGIHVELTNVEPKTEEWKERLERVHRGLDAVEAELREGARVDDLTETFAKSLDLTKDRFYGKPVQHVGYEPLEQDIPLDTVQRYDCLRVGIPVSDGEHTALVFRSVHTIDDDDAKDNLGALFRATMQEREYGAPSEGELRKIRKEFDDIVQGQPQEMKDLSNKLYEIIVQWKTAFANAPDESDGKASTSRTWGFSRTRKAQTSPSTPNTSPQTSDPSNENFQKLQTLLRDVDVEILKQLSSDSQVSRILGSDAPEMTQKIVLLRMIQKINSQK